MLIKFSSLVLAVAAISSVVDAWGDAGGDAAAGDGWKPWSGGDPWGGGWGDPEPAPKPDKPDIDPGINKDCLCKKYLKDKSWDYLHKFGIKMENFCCLVGAVSNCLDTPHIAIYDPPAVDYATWGYKVPYALYRCIDQAGIGKLAHYYPDTYSTGGTYLDGDELPYTPKGKDGKDYFIDNTNNVGYGYQKPACSWSYNYADYIKCIFTIYFDQAKQACYCYYRTKVHCVCDDCDKDVKLDRSIAYNNPQLICNQCPDKHVDKPGDGYGGDSKPYGNYKPPKKTGYDVYFRGSPYDPCAGYCLLISGYDKNGDIYLPAGDGGKGYP